MQETWLKKEGNADVVIFMLGWASTPNAVLHVLPEGCDVLCYYDYCEYHALKADAFAGYRRIYLFAWSFGVWAAEQCCRDLPLYRATALNGTPFPVDDRFGMRLRVVMRTMQGLARVGMNPFNEKTYGGIRAIPEGPFEERSIEEKIEELRLLAEASQANSAAHIAWDAAWIGDKDEIFPPERMRAYWQPLGIAHEFESYHYPFADPQIVRRVIDES